jgi:hypothetical protein
MGTINDMLKKLEEFQKEIESNSGQEIKIIPDANGMIDRQCPNEECKSFFKVNQEDWTNLVKDEKAYCPFCKFESKAKDYFPTEQFNSIKESLHSAIMDNWNYGKSISQNIIALHSKDEFELHIKCEECNVRYSVIGAAYFCPCCGFDSIEKNARFSIEKIILKAKKNDSVKEAYEQIFSKDDAVIYTNIDIENSILNCLSTLQSFSESRYNYLSKTKAPFNAFQNIEKSNKLWITLKNQGYETWLTRNEYRQIIVYTERRHLLGHKAGKVDSKYLEGTKENKLKVGGRIVVKAKDVISLGHIVLKIIDSINNLK